MFFDCTTKRITAEEGAKITHTQKKVCFIFISLEFLSTSIYKTNNTEQ